MGRRKKGVPKREGGTEEEGGRAKGANRMTEEGGDGAGAGRAKEGHEGGTWSEGLRGMG